MTFTELLALDRKDNNPTEEKKVKEAKKPSVKSERKKRTPKPTGRTVRPNASKKPSPALKPKKNKITSDTNVIDQEKLKIVVKSLSKTPVTDIVYVRVSKQEKEDLNEFVHEIMKRENISRMDVNASKLFRYCTRYMMKVHEKEFIAAVIEAQDDDNELPI